MIKRVLLFQDMPIRQRVIIITVGMCILTAGLGFSLFTTHQANILFSEKELVGVEYLTTLRQLWEHLPQHRSLMAAHEGGQGEPRERIISLRTTIDGDLQRLETVDRKLGQTLETAGQLQTIMQGWQALKQRDFNIKPADSFAQHAQLLSALMTLIQQVADHSNLILDPVIDTYYLMDTVVNKLPDMVESVGKMHSLGSIVTIRKGRTTEEQLQLRLFADRSQKSLEVLRRTMQVLQREPQALANQLAPVASKAFENVESFVRLTTERVIEAESVTVLANDYYQAGSKVMGDLVALYDRSLTALRDLLQARRDALHTQRTWQLAIALGLAVLTLGATLRLHRLIARQVASIRSLLGHIEMGNYEARAEVLSQDELGGMALALNTALDHILQLVQSQDERDAIQASIMKLLEEVSGVAEGDLRIEAEVTDDVTGAIADSFNYMILQLRTIVTQVQDATLQVSASANEIQVTAEHLAEGSTTQASQILDSSAAIDEMAVSIQQVSENAALSAQVASQALTNAKQGTTAVHNTIEGMQRIRSQVQETAKRIKRLGERSQEISEIVQLIGDIADRTSILALNASIQAARAGEAGRAFVVVAEEVERLAERSSNATKQIAGLVNTIQSETNEAMTAMEESTHEVVQGSRLADQAGQALGEIEEVSAQLAELIQSISLAAKQQARGSESLSQAMGEISDVTQQTAAGTKEAAVSIHNLANLADNLRESMSTFKLPANMNERSRVA